MKDDIYAYLLATSVYEEYRGWEDESILEKAYSESRIVVTIDKDFGEMLFRRKLLHCAVILLRSGFADPLKKIFSSREYAGISSLHVNL